MQRLPAHIACTFPLFKQNSCQTRQEVRLNSKMALGGAWGDRTPDLLHAICGSESRNPNNREAICEAELHVKGAIALVLAGALCSKFVSCFATGCQNSNLNGTYWPRASRNPLTNARTVATAC